MSREENNFAFIDGQNLYRGINDWELDYRKLRIYLKDKYSVTTAYIHIGFKSQYIGLYTKLQEDGYVINFKPTLPDRNNTQKNKGNVDVDLAVKSLIWRKRYDKAVIVTSDGDFDTLVSYLRKKNKLKVVLSPNKDYCSSLLQIAAGPQIDYINNFKSKVQVESKRKSTATRRNR